MQVKKKKSVGDKLSPTENGVITGQRFLKNKEEKLNVPLPTLTCRYEARDIINLII